MGWVLRSCHVLVLGLVKEHQQCFKLNSASHGRCVLVLLLERQTLCPKQAPEWTAWRSALLRLMKFKQQYTLLLTATHLFQRIKAVGLLTSLASRPEQPPTQ